MELLRFDSCDRDNRTITLNPLEWHDPWRFCFAKDLPFPRLDGIAPGDYVSVQFEVIEFLKGWPEKRIVSIEKYQPDEDSEFT
jgi:hypothetical protein